MSDHRNVSPFARLLGAIHLGGGAASEVARSARERLCLNCEEPLPIARTPEEQERFCKDCRDAMVDGAANLLGRIVKRIW